MKLPGDIDKLMREDPDIPDRYKKYLAPSDSPSESDAHPRELTLHVHRSAPVLGAPTPTTFWTRLCAILMYCPIRRRPIGESLSLSIILWRLLEGLVLRALLTPLVLALFIAILVHFTTHPARIQAELTPGTLGLPYRAVSVPVSDGLLLDGWFIPALDPETTAALGSQGNNIKRPGILLVHGLGHSADSYLGLAAQLHKRGFAVLMISTRGQGASSDAPITFGLRESSDVISSINYLRRQPGVRPDAIAAVGFGTGGIAVLRANASNATPLVTVVADSVWPHMDNYLSDSFRTRPEFPTENLAPFYRMGFEAITGQSLADWNLVDALSSIPNRPLILIRQGHERAPMRDFIRATDQLADLTIIPLDDTATQNTAADTATLTHLTQSLGKY